MQLSSDTGKKEGGRQRNGRMPVKTGGGIGLMLLITKRCSQWPCNAHDYMTSLSGALRSGKMSEKEIVIFPRV